MPSSQSIAWYARNSKPVEVSVTKFSDIMNEIAESMLSGRLSLWVGAGISHNDPSGLPLADELKFHILERICPDSGLRLRLSEEGNLRSKSSAYPLEATIHLISRHRDLLETIAELFRSGSPNRTHLLIAKLMQKGLLKEVFTTNLDLLIERAFEKSWQKGVDFDVCAREDQFGAILSDSSHPRIYKIHGSADDLQSMRVTLDLVASKRLSQPRAKLLESFMNSSEGELLVLGYGAKDEFDLNPVLHRISSKKHIFFVHHAPGKYEISEELPLAFRQFHGVTIHCLTDQIIDRMWSLLGEDPKPLKMETKDWRTIVNEWVGRVPEPNRFFIMGLYLHSVQEFEDARKAYSQARQGFERQGDLGNLVASLHQLGIIAHHFGETSDAENLYRESMRINEKAGNKLGLALDLHQLGLVAQHRGDPETENIYKRSLDLMRSLGSQGERYVPSTLHQLAVLAVFRTDYDVATRLCRESLELREKLGDELGAADSYSLLGDISLLLGEKSLKEAEAHHRRSLETRKNLVDQKGIAMSLHELGIIALHQGNWAESERLTRESLNLRTEIGDKEGIGLSKAQLGNLYESIGQLEDSERLFAEARQILLEIGSTPLAEKASRDIERIQEKIRIRKAEQVSTSLGKLEQSTYW
jgi:tetratricopeptide (TPR) repeat protein